MASCQKSRQLEAASANMRRLFGPRGSGSRQDALLTEEAAESHVSDEDLDISAAYEEGPPKKGGDKVKGDGQTMNRPNRTTGMREKRYRREGEYHLTPLCSWRDAPQRGVSPVSQGSARDSGFAPTCGQRRRQRDW